MALPAAPAHPQPFPCHPPSSYSLPGPWPVALPSNSSTRLPPLAAWAQTPSEPYFPTFFLTFSTSSTRTSLLAPNRLSGYLPHHLNTSTEPSPSLSDYHHPSSFSNNQVCSNFNCGRCTRQSCSIMHICSFCGCTHACIICPVFKSANKNEKPNLLTPMHNYHLTAELSHQPDTNFTDYLLSDLTHGFNPRVKRLPRQSIICANVQSAVAEPDTIDLLIKKEVESNFMTGPFNVPSFRCF